MSHDPSHNSYLATTNTDPLLVTPAQVADIPKSYQKALFLLECGVFASCGLVY